MVFLFYAIRHHHSISPFELVVMKAVLDKVSIPGYETQQKGDDAAFSELCRVVIKVSNRMKRLIDQCIKSMVAMHFGDVCPTSAQTKGAPVDALSLPYYIEGLAQDPVTTLETLAPVSAIRATIAGVVMPCHPARYVLPARTKTRRARRACSRDDEAGRIASKHREVARAARRQGLMQCPLCRALPMTM